MTGQELLNLIDLCRYEPNVDRQVQILHQINDQLPEMLRIKFPSLLTNDYVNRALDIVEDKIRYHEGGQFFVIFEYDRTDLRIIK